MKKKVLLFAPTQLIRQTLVEQISLKRNLDVIETVSLDNVKRELEKSSFDLIIMDTNQGSSSLTSIRKFIKDLEITNIILFMVKAGFMDGPISSDDTKKYLFLEKPFRIEHLYKSIFTSLAKISNSNEMTHKIGPFTFFPLKKVVVLDDKKKVELTEKEVDILRCLISSDGEAINKDKLLKKVWNYSSNVTTHTLETHIYRLRQKLEIDPSIPRLIIAEDGGFKIR